MEDAERIAPDANLPAAIEMLRNYKPLPGDHVPWWVSDVSAYRVRTFAGFSLPEPTAEGYALEENDRKTLQEILGATSLHDLYALMPFPLSLLDREAAETLAAGLPSSVEKLARAMPSCDHARFCILMHERITSHSCRYIKVAALREMLRIAYGASPVGLVREAGGRKALAEMYRFAGLALPWERQARPLPAAEGMK
ncbi:hypothetical protein HOP60_01280 [Halomonas daqingensis]|uniref:Uncharacterized protein n=1 Tax=Billgrantia desiderata TaxID=52021 RepID=A0ABS9B0R5_9GAMM|nr:hypothetical protein [Halomonas desiderata]MCE8040784.1 hypothetical protein [Halomonas desiderata]MCE8045359.1 hypothetical protein [Halomonas desiderata]